MGKIIKLPEHIANKIAAGEVVERPASVVKELVENSIDAGAQNIEIIIKQAGKELIQIIDDGEGMTEEDMLIAFERHATSKITSEKDLETIYTLGFRGEALPSIASVSNIEMKSRTQISDTGIQIQLSAGKLTANKPVQMATGTQISVKNLFFNTPARRHFLRSDTTELQHILTTLKRFFISFPHIGFKLIVNDKTIYSFPGESIDKRLINIFGKIVYDGFIHFTSEKNGMTLEGYIARPDLARNSRGMEFLFLNNRPISSRSFHYAIIQAYGNSIERRQYPPYVMYLGVPANDVDVNVHPTKMEVKFRNEHHVYQLIYHAVKNALNRENVVPVFTVSGDTPSSGENDMQFQQFQHPETGNSFTKKIMYSNQGRLDLTSALFGQDNTSQIGHDDSDETSFATEFSTQDMQKEQPEKKTDTPSVLFQLHNKYILAQSENGLMIIDQHVAHERILFEKATESLSQQTRLPSQQLLFPQTLELTMEDYMIYSDISESLHLLGFSTTELSGRTIVIESIPTYIKTGYEAKVLLEILDYFKETDKVKNPNNDTVSAAFACKNAVKSGDSLSHQEMEYLLAQLFQCKEPFFCPHGRPVIISLPLEELDKKFKRIK
ncbi:MAG: DNA mismatch repair endonuclease MutL [Calditrichia bacterium]